MVELYLRYILLTAALTIFLKVFFIISSIILFVTVHPVTILMVSTVCLM